MKLPLILAREEFPTSVPYPRASGAAAAAPYEAEVGIYQAAERGVRDAGEVATMIAKVEAAKYAQGVKVESNAMKSEMDAQTANGLEDLKLKEQDPDGYLQKADDLMQRVHDTLATTAKYPETKTALQQHLLKIRATQGHEAKKYSNQLYIDRNKALLETTLENFKLRGRNAPDQVNGEVNPETPLSNIDFYIQGRQAIQDMLPTLGPKGVQERLDKWRNEYGEDLEKTRIRRGWDEPANRPTLIRGLTQGVYSFIPGNEQIVLRDELVRQGHIEREAERKELDRMRKEIADEGERAIVDTVRAKDWTQANTALARYGQYMSGEEKRAWAQYIDTAEKAKEKKESDPATRTAMSMMVYTADTPATMSSARAAVLRAVGSGALDAADGDKYLGHLQSLTIANRNRTEDKALDAYHRERSAVKDQLQEDLRVTGPLANILPQAQQTLAMALDDLNRNVPVSSANGEAPRAWYNRTKATWVSHVSTAAATRLLEINRQVAPYKDVSALMAAEATFANKADFLDRLRLMRDAEMIRQEMQRMKGLPTNDKPAGESGGAKRGNTLGYKD